MKNLIRVFTKNYFIFLFGFLMFSSFVLLVKNNNFQHSRFFNSSNFLIGNLYTTINIIDEYFHLKEENTNLAAQNAQLLSHQIKSYTKINEKTVVINDTVYAQKYTHIFAKAINTTTNKRENYTTLDRGKANGVEAGMGVVSSSGVIGTVKNVSENFCSVMSILHEKNAVSVKIKKSGYKGSLVWELGDYKTAQLKDIPNHVKLNKGDIIITTGYSMIYPEGILVGEIIAFDLPEGSNFYNITVKLSVDYKKLSHVFIVKSWTKNEQKELEALNNENR